MTEDMSATAWSVSQAIEVLNTQLFRIAGPKFIVEGEVGKVQVSQGKWVSFDLKDAEDGSVLRCWGTIYQMPVLPQEGERVRVVSTPKVNGKYGQFSLQVHGVEWVGKGAWQAALLALRHKLEAEGLFAEGRKRAVPTMPDRIGLITSRDAAAYGDFLRVLAERWGGVDVLFCQVAVQGDRVAADVCRALDRLEGLPAQERPQLVVMTRGGGSAEELMMWNAEVLVRRVAASSIPVVAAIGHERDVCLVELAADVRAATPSHAAQCIVPDRQALRHTVGFLMASMEHGMDEARRGAAWRLELALRAQRERLAQVRGRVERAQVLTRALLAGVAASAARASTRVRSATHAMAQATVRAQAQALARVQAGWRLAESLHPARVLARGYAVVRRQGQVVRAASQVKPEEGVVIELASGSISATVNLCQP
jgi:exodeoxyribonuclease VII large subunit